jgi:hypothetical protein
MAQRHQRFAGHLEIAVRHGDRGFLVRAGEKFRHLVAAVIDQRLVDGAEAGSRVRRQIFDIEGLDDVDHEVGAGNATDPRQFLRRRGLGDRDLHGGRQRGRPPRCADGRIRGGSGLRRWRCQRRCRARDRSSGQEFAPTHLGTRMFSCHGVSPLRVMRSALRLAPARSSSWAILSSRQHAEKALGAGCVLNIQFSVRSGSEQASRAFPLNEGAFWTVEGFRPKRRRIKRRCRLEAVPCCG